MGTDSSFTSKEKMMLSLIHSQSELINSAHKAMMVFMEGHNMRHQELNSRLIRLEELIVSMCKADSKNSIQ